MKPETSVKPKELSTVEQKILLLVQHRNRCRFAEVTATISVFFDVPTKVLTDQIWRLVDLGYLHRLLNPKAISGEKPDHLLELSAKGFSACQQIQEAEKQLADQQAKEDAAKRDQRAFEWKKTFLSPLIQTGVSAIAGMLLEHYFGLLSWLFQWFG